MHTPSLRIPIASLITIAAVCAYIPTTYAAELSFDQQEALTQSAFYEDNGTLKPVDTSVTTDKDSNSFVMNKARWNLTAPTTLEAGKSIQAKYNDLSINLSPKNLFSSVGTLKNSSTEEKNNTIHYKDALGDGIHMDITADPLELKKVVQIDSKESLKSNDIPFKLTLPKDAAFEVNGQEWNKQEKLEVTNKVIRIKHKDSEAYIRPAKVWGASNKEQSITLTLEQNEEGTYTLTKHLPADFLETATYPVYTDATISFGSEYVFNAGNSTYTSISTLDSTHVAIAYKDVGNSSYGTAIIGTISGTTISYGSEYVFNSASIQDVSISALDSTHVVIVYMDAGNSNFGTAIVGTISGTSISFGTEVVFNAGSSTFNSISTIDSTHVAIAYRDFSNSAYGTAIIGTISGTTISYGSEYVFNAASTDYISISTIDSTHVAIAYRDLGNSSYGTAIVGTISGTTISYGAEYVFNVGSSFYIFISTLDSTHVAIVYSDNGNGFVGTAVVGTISGTSISFGPEAVYNSSTTSFNSISTIDSTHVVIAYQDGGNSSYGTAIIGTISGTSISFGSEYVFDAASSQYTSISTLDSTHVAIAYQDVGNSFYGTAVVGTVSLVDGYSLSGTVYTDEGTTTMGASRTVAVSINGASAATTADTNGSGAFTLTGVSTTAGDVLTLYIDGETEKAVTVTVATGADQTGLNLYQNDLITRCDNSSCSLTNANLETAETNADADISSIYSVASSNLTLASGKSLFIPASHTYAPGGNVTVPGNFTNNGTFTRGTGTVTLNGTNQTIAGSTTFYDLTKAVSSAATLTFTAGTTQTIANTLTLNAESTRPLSLRSSTAGSTYTIDPQGTRSVSYLDVQDATNSNTTAVSCTLGCANSGNNINWDFGTSGSGDEQSDTGRSTSSDPEPLITPMPTLAIRESLTTPINRNVIITRPRESKRIFLNIKNREALKTATLHLDTKQKELKNTIKLTHIPLTSLYTLKLPKNLNEGAYKYTITLTFQSEGTTTTKKTSGYIANRNPEDIKQIYAEVFNKQPTTKQLNAWTARYVPNDKKTLTALKGAMEFNKLKAERPVKGR